MGRLAGLGNARTACVLLCCAKPPEQPCPTPRLTRRAVVYGSTAAAAAVGWPGKSALAGMDQGRLPAGSALSESQSLLIWQPSSEVRGKNGGGNAFPVRFTTYLARFLLNFDTSSREWWEREGQALPLRADRIKVAELRARQFSQYSESVQLGLSQFSGPAGTRQLYSLLRSRYGANRQGKLQLALLFSLLPPDTQPTDLIRRALGEADNATVTSITVTDPGAGYLLPPAVAISPPDAAGAGSPALARAKMAIIGDVGAVLLFSGGSGYVDAPAVIVSPPAAWDGRAARVEATVEDGKVVNLRIVDCGEGYARGDAARVSIDPPRDESGNPLASAQVAEARSYLSLRVEAIEVVGGGFGYARDQRIDVSLAPVSLPAAAAWAFGGSTATFATPAVSGGAAGAAGAPAPADATRPKTVAVARAARATAELYTSMASDMQSGRSSLSLALAGSPESVSSHMLALLPSTLRPRRIDPSGRSNASFVVELPPMLRPSGWERAAAALGRDPIFGPLGTSPVQRELALKPSDYFAFALSGAACTATVRTVLVPIELTKTLMQARPAEYPALLPGLRKLRDEGGLRKLYTGVDVTLLLGCLLGGVGFGANEFLRRALTMMAADEAPLYVLQIQALASLGAVLAACLATCPLEVLRIRAFAAAAASPVAAPVAASVAAGAAGQEESLAAPAEWAAATPAAELLPPEKEWSLLKGLPRLFAEGGLPLLYSSLPQLLARELPFTITKFLVFDAAVSAISSLLPSLAENGQTSFFVSLAGGAIAGVVAGAVSTPADAIITRRLADRCGKEAPRESVLARGAATVLSPAGLAELRAEAASLFRGVGARCLLFGMIIAGQYLLYDVYKRLFKVSPNDIVLVLDVFADRLAFYSESGLGGPPL